jgi:hypothetical protein
MSTSLLPFVSDSILHWQSASPWMKQSPGRVCICWSLVCCWSPWWQWGTFMVYMRTPEAVLFPRPRKPHVAEQQNAARQARQVTIINVTQNIGSIQGGEVAGVSAGSIGSQTRTGKAGGGAETDG